MVYNATSANHGEAATKRSKVRIPALRAAKGKQKLAAITCYDATFARLLDRTAIDIVLVGDSLGHVVQGLQSTIPVTCGDICYHTRAVARAGLTAHLVADMPFGMAGLRDERCFDAAVEIMQSGAEAVKIEGSSPEILRQIGQLVRQGIPVMGHIGLTPQSVHSIGGYRIQGKTKSAIEALIDSAQALQEAGCYAIVLELCTDSAGKAVTEAISIPTIGIGSGPDCDGQILVLHDMLGMNAAFTPKFLKHYEHLEERITSALNSYTSEVQSGVFPRKQCSDG